MSNEIQYLQKQMDFLDNLPDSNLSPKSDDKTVTMRHPSPPKSKSPKRIRPTALTPKQDPPPKTTKEEQFEALYNDILQKNEGDKVKTM